MSKRNEAIWDAFSGPIRPDVERPEATLTEDEEDDRG
jgi:hypothetical protein